ncbi:MAG: EAL domain-containing protein [Lachnospiraceae bacterium]|jgi:EAL domain-containing protein (putative c-di-GMP-specific phosphodiesterase class I)|nr:EAL domain-containing protein [Lachnospiraceae bacterium]MEE3460298.1 EAL domain-containing protein [Lachnospiraceae bacterium]
MREYFSDSLSFYSNYTPAVDVVIFTMCILILILMLTTYINRDRFYFAFRCIFVCVALSGGGSLFFHLWLEMYPTSPLIYLFRLFFHFFTLCTMTSYLAYILIAISSSKRRNELMLVTSFFINLGVIACDIIGSVYHWGFSLDNPPEGGPYSISVFRIVLFLYFAFGVAELAIHKKQLFPQIFKGIMWTLFLSIMILVTEIFNNQSSFALFALAMPMIALLFLMHANPYDAGLGTLDQRAFSDYIEEKYKHHKELAFISVYIPEFEGNIGFPTALKKMIKDFYNKHSRKAVLFKITNGRLIMVIRGRKVNMDRVRFIAELFRDKLEKEYTAYKYDYKLVVTKTYDGLSHGNDYISFIKYIEKSMAFNTIETSSSQQFEDYNDMQYILYELEDITHKRNLDDPRVLVYCQPVFNTTERTYDTAEALMRLKLDRTGIVYPDQFIPLAESHNYIHMLSLIMLNKTCKQIKSLLDNNYIVKRISVNFSVIDVRDENFCMDIQHIIMNTGIPISKVAVEITESHNYNDFLLMKSKINELKEHGILFYLDDFGTGYSNFDRIIELPFDIIKFDRSLVIASSKDRKSETMVNYLAHMFSELNYSVLYEGIEDSKDEEMCENMCAKYLQGYKYSRPIPIEQLTEYFKRSA